MELKEKWVLILGGSSGLGAGCARAFAKKGKNVLVIHRDRKSAEEDVLQLKIAIQSEGVKCHFINKNAVDEAVVEDIIQELKNDLGVINIETVIYSISRGNLGQLFQERQLNVSDFNQTIQSMSLFWLHWIQRLYHHQMLSATCSTLAFNSEGEQKVWKGYAAVSASKAVLVSIMKSISVEGRPLGIRANLIQAGITATPSLNMIPGAGELLEHNKKRNPSGRNTTVDDVSKVAVWLSSSEAEWINGEIITVDGGEKNIGV